MTIRLNYNMENMRLGSSEPVVYIKEEHTHISALNPIDLNIQEEDEFDDKTEHKVYCSLTVVNPEEITYDSVGSDDYNSDWVFGLQSSESSHQQQGSQKNNNNSNDNTQQTTTDMTMECDLSNDSTYSRLDNSSSDSMITYYTLPNETTLVNFSHHESPVKRVDFTDWNNCVPPEQVKKVNTPPAKKIPQVHICQVCKKIFATKSNLDRHGVVHCDVKPFQCVECKKMFSRRVHLERHKFLHMDKKPFNCEVCNKGFTQKSHLDKHVYIHTGVKPFACSICQKTFARKESLNRHNGTHTAAEKAESMEKMKKELEKKESEKLEKEVKTEKTEDTAIRESCEKKNPLPEATVTKDNHETAIAAEDVITIKKE